MTSNILPTGAALTRDVIRRDFSWFGKTEEIWSRTRFLVPKDWHNLSSPTDYPGTTELITVAAFTSASGQASIRLQAIRLEREISAELWLRHYLIVAGNRPVVLIPVSPVFADSLSEFKIDNERISGRIAARIHGQLLFLIVASCPASRYAEFSESFGVSIASFRPDSEPEAPTIETRMSARIADLLGFEYPASWSLREVPAIAEHHATDLLGMNFGQPTGMIRVKIAIKGDPEILSTQLDAARDEFASAGIQCGNLIANAQPSPLNTRFRSVQTHVFDAVTQTGLPQELWVTCVEDNAHWITISLLTPAREEHFLFWAWNRTALNIVSGSLN